MSKKRYRYQWRFNRIIIVLIILLVTTITLISNNVNTTKMYISSTNSKVAVYDDKLNKIDDLARGSIVYKTSKKITKNKHTYIKIKYNNENGYVNSINIVANRRNSVQETKIFVRTPATIYSNIDKGTIAGEAGKGASYDIINYSKLDNKGNVYLYKIKYNNGTGYIYGKYTATNKDSAMLNYEPNKYYDIHSQRGNRFGGGNAGALDYYPVVKPTFSDNIMPKEVYSLYLTSGVLKNVDAYIDFAKQTQINAFVVDIKDNESPGYKSKVFEQYSPTNYKYATNSLESYKTAIKKIKEAGYYVIGRITVFKDKYYVDDNPDIAILDSRTNKPYLHSGTYWPSPYQRKVWQFNVDLAKEAVKEMGFNEIQFDYVRFPDRTQNDEKNGIMVFRNDYKEEKAQAIQRFLMYAADELHKVHAYVAADVFGESAYTYVTAYGQYWAAISNVVDVISGMPYPDHFNKYEFDFTKPVWTVPYELLNYWGSNYVAKRQAECPTPAVMRTWIQVSDVPSYKYAGGYKYGDKQIDEEIRGLFDAGLTGGYMTWLSSAQLSRYKSQINIYKKEY